LFINILIHKIKKGDALRFSNVWIEEDRLAFECIRMPIECISNADSGAYLPRRGAKDAGNEEESR